MKQILAAISIALCAAPLTSWADDGDHHRHEKSHKHRHHERKEVFWDGHCKVERKWKNDGRYKEKRECKGRSHGHHGHQAQRPVYVQPQAVHVRPQPQGLVINTQIHVRP